MKKITVFERSCWQCRPALMAFAVVERFKHESMYAECPPGQKSSRCGEVAALVEVRLYTFTSLLMDTLLKPTAIVVTCLSFSF